MKNAARLYVLLVFCAGCGAVGWATERYGPGPDSVEFEGAFAATVQRKSEAISVLATWYADTYGFESFGEPVLQDPAGVLVVTQDAVIFFAWGDFEYTSAKTIAREDLETVLVEASGKSRLLVLVAEGEVNTFELVRDDRRFVDVESTEAIAALLADALPD
ncbi:MAG: hypothetical protein KJP17_10480 [Gammaproteobacteria bacterium]|nr:hypothetical protein [Gammaproteobacteria bacterium]